MLSTINKIPPKFMLGNKTEALLSYFFSRIVVHVFILIEENKKIRWVAMNWSKCPKQKWWGHYVLNTMPTISQFLCHFSPQRLLHENDLLPTLFCFLSFLYTLLPPYFSNLSVFFFSWIVCLILSHFCDLKVRKRFF